MMDKQQAKAAVFEEITAFVNEFNGLCEKHGIMAMAVGLGVKKDRGGLSMISGFVASAVENLDCRQAAVFTKTLMRCAEVWSEALKKAKCVCPDKAAAGHDNPVESVEVEAGKDGETKIPDFGPVSVEEFVEFVNDGSPESKDLIKAVLTRFWLPREELEKFRKAFQSMTTKWKKDKDAVRAAGAGGPSVAIDPAMQAWGGGGDPKDYKRKIFPNGPDPRTHVLHFGRSVEWYQKDPIRVTEKQVEAWKSALDAGETIEIVDAVTGKMTFRGSARILAVATKAIPS